MATELGRRGIPADRIRRVAPGVSEPAIPVRVVRTRPRRLITVGRLVARKGQDRTIEAVASLSSVHPDLRYEIVGDGPDRGRLRDLIARHGLRDRVVLRGRLTGAALERAYARADLFVMPAREEPGGDTEGYGLVYLEAGARGLPVIGGRTAGAAEAVQHEQTGLLVDAPNDPQAVAAAISRMIADPRALAECGARGRRRFETSGRPVDFARAVVA
jgi:phosphatidylinositol alpha-1,6-mannosyltransferase